MEAGGNQESGHNRSNRRRQRRSNRQPHSQQALRSGQMQSRVQQLLPYQQPRYHLPTVPNSIGVTPHIPPIGFDHPQHCMAYNTPVHQQTVWSNAQQQLPLSNSTIQQQDMAYQLEAVQPHKDTQISAIQPLLTIDASHNLEIARVLPGQCMPTVLNQSSESNLVDRSQEVPANQSPAIPTKEEVLFVIARMEEVMLAAEKSEPRVQDLPEWEEVDSDEEYQDPQVAHRRARQEAAQSASISLPNSASRTPDAPIPSIERGGAIRCGSIIVDTILTPKSEEVMKRDGTNLHWTYGSKLPGNVSANDLLALCNDVLQMVDPINLHDHWLLKRSIRLTVQFDHFLAERVNDPARRDLLIAKWDEHMLAQNALIQDLVDACMQKLEYLVMLAVQKDVNDQQRSRSCQRTIDTLDQECQRFLQRWFSLRGDFANDQLGVVIVQAIDSPDIRPYMEHCHGLFPYPNFLTVTLTPFLEQAIADKTGFGTTFYHGTPVLMAISNI